MDSTENVNSKKMHKVMILYTGGTIGMTRTENGLAPCKGFLSEQLSKMHQFQDPAYLPQRVMLESKMPVRVTYDIVEYDPLLDSSNMSREDWISIASDIEKYYADYDGFVILHGTDTMSYTASALSFMLENLSKPVILTCSQIPLEELRND